MKNNEENSINMINQFICSSILCAKKYQQGVAAKKASFRAAAQKYERTTVNVLEPVTILNLAGSPTVKFHLPFVAGAEESMDPFPQ